MDTLAWEEGTGVSARNRIDELRLGGGDLIVRDEPSGSHVRGTLADRVPFFLPFLHFSANEQTVTRTACRLSHSDVSIIIGREEIKRSLRSSVARVPGDTFARGRRINNYRDPRECRWLLRIVEIIPSRDYFSTLWLLVGYSGRSARPCPFRDTLAEITRRRPRQASPPLPHPPRDIEGEMSDKANSLTRSPYRRRVPLREPRTGKPGNARRRSQDEGVASGISADARGLLFCDYRPIIVNKPADGTAGDGSRTGSSRGSLAEVERSIIGSQIVSHSRVLAYVSS